MYASYSPNLYTDGLASLGMNAAVQQAYYPAVMGSASGGDCPQGSLNQKWQQGAGNLPGGVCRSPEIPIGNTKASNPTNPPFPTLADVGGQALADTVAQTQVTGFDLECCPSPGLCQEEVFFRSAFKGCPYTYFEGPNVEINPNGDRYNIADLNPLLFERALLTAAEQNPYNYMSGRQILLQFLSKDLVNVSDRYCRPITSVDRSYVAQHASHGNPAFTTF